VKSVVVVVAWLAAGLAGSAGAAPASKAKHHHHRHRNHATTHHGHATTHHGHANKKVALRHMSSRFEAPSDAAELPAVRYGAMSRDACEAELGKRGIGFTREAEAPGVLAPVRLTGPLHGIVFRSDESEAKRAVSPYEVGDCRLVLALDDFAAILATHDIVEVRHYSMWRPSKSLPEGTLGTRHSGALALDAARFTTKEGKVLDVLKDFHGAIGAKTCGDGAGPRPATESGKELRAILCETVGHHLFNVVLTPNYNKPHRNHFHLEVTAGVTWFLVH
jgi:Extensin-like protein C-terminus